MKKINGSMACLYAGMITFTGFILWRITLASEAWFSGLTGIELGALCALCLVTYLIVRTFVFPDSITLIERKLGKDWFEDKRSLEEGILLALGGVRGIELRLSKNLQTIEPNEIVERPIFLSMLMEDLCLRSPTREADQEVITLFLKRSAGSKSIEWTVVFEWAFHMSSDVVHDAVREQRKPA